MEKISAPKSSTVYTYGLYLGIASIVFSLIIYYGGFIGNKYFGYLGFIFTILFISLGLINYRDKINNGILTYSQGLGIGVLITLIGSVISSVFSYVFLTFIDPDIHKLIVANSQEEALKNGMTEAQLDQAGKVMDIMMSPMVLSILGIIMSVFFGFIFTLIISAIVKKDPEIKM